MAFLQNTGQNPQGQSVPIPVAGIAQTTTQALSANQSWDSGIMPYKGNEAVHFAIASDVAGTYSIQYYLNGQLISFTGNPTAYDPDMVNSFQGALSGKGDSFKLVYTNGPVAQSRFYLEIRFGDDIQQTLRSIGVPISATNMGSTTHAVIEGREDGTGNYKQATVTTAGSKTAQDVNVVNASAATDVSALAKEATLKDGSQKTQITNLPATQAISGTVSVSNLPATQPVSGTVAVNNFPASQNVAVSNFPATQPVSGSLGVNNFPANQTVSGTVAVSNFPSTQPISGNVGITGQVAISNLPSTQPVSGTVAINNLPSIQQVSGNISVSNFPSSQAVTGNIGITGQVGISNFPVTQAISAASLPLPTGASTSAKQDTGNTALGTPADAVIVDPTASASIISLLKGLLQESVAAGTTGTLSSIVLVANVQQTIAANVNRKMVVVSSTSGTILIGVGFTATATNWSYRIVTNGTLELPASAAGLSISLLSTSASTVNLTQIT